MKDKLTRTDVIFFDYTYKSEALSVQRKFLSSLYKSFPSLQLEKSVNNSVVVKNIEAVGEAQYYAWIIANSFYAHSNEVTKMMTSTSNKEKYTYCLNLAKHTYPNKWKKLSN